MSSRWASFVVSGKSIIVVRAEIGEGINERLNVLSFDEWTIEEVRNPVDRARMYQKCGDYLAEHPVDEVIIKASATGPTKSGLAHLETAEFRGVIIAAAASVRPVILVRRSAVSIRFGDRKVGEYMDDDQFWIDTTLGGVDLVKPGREALIYILDRLSVR